MALLKSIDESKIRDILDIFLKKRFGTKGQKNKPLFLGFAPDHILEKNNKKYMVLFRNPPDIPEIWLKEIRLALKNGIGVYIAIYNHEYEKLLENFLSKCESFGIGVMQYGVDKNNFTITLTCLIDRPKEDVLQQNLINIFISSKLNIE